MKFYKVCMIRSMSPVYEQKIIGADSEEHINKHFENGYYINSIIEIEKPNKADILLWD